MNKQELIHFIIKDILSDSVRTDEDCHKRHILVCKTKFYKKILYVRMFFTCKVHDEIVQFILFFSNNKMRAPVLRLAQLSSCFPHAFVLLVGT